MGSSEETQPAVGNVLSADDKAALAERGYVMVPQVVSQAGVSAAVDVVLARCQADLSYPATWYRSDPDLGDMVPVWGHQALWNNRQEPRVHRAFSELWDTERLWVSLDRASFKPPAHPDHPRRGRGLQIHWDVDVTKSRERALQGVLYLSDAAGADEGTFICVPELYRELDAWVEAHPDGNWMAPALDGHAAEAVPGRAGDLLIFDSRLPHGSAPNTSDRPRIAQYIAMFPAPAQPGDDAEQRVRLWREGRVQPGWAHMRHYDHQEPWPPARLSPLGRRLLGAEPWG